MSALIQVTHCERCNRTMWVSPDEPYAFVPSTLCQPTEKTPEKLDDSTIRQREDIQFPTILK